MWHQLRLSCAKEEHALLSQLFFFSGPSQVLPVPVWGRIQQVLVSIPWYISIWFLLCLLYIIYLKISQETKAVSCSAFTSILLTGLINFLLLSLNRKYNNKKLLQKFIIQWPMYTDRTLCSILVNYLVLPLRVSSLMSIVSMSVRDIGRIWMNWSQKSSKNS